VTGSDRARPHAPSAPPPPPWRKVLATTIRLWWQRHIARPLAWRITIGALVVALVAASATAVVLGLRSAPGPSQAAVTKSQDPATDTAAVAAAAQYRQQAAAWVTAQVDHGAIVACDPLMCATLQQHGFPAAGLSSISAASSDPLGSGVVVSTAAVRDQLGSRLTSVYAPTVLASFGSGQGLVQVLVTAPGGATAYRAALQSDVEARTGEGLAEPVGPGADHLVVQAADQQQRPPARLAEVLIGDLDVPVARGAALHLGLPPFCDAVAL